MLALFKKREAGRQAAPAAAGCREGEPQESVVVLYCYRGRSVGRLRRASASVWGRCQFFPRPLPWRTRRKFVGGSVSEHASFQQAALALGAHFSTALAAAPSPPQLPDGFGKRGSAPVPPARSLYPARALVTMSSNPSSC